MSEPANHRIIWLDDPLATDRRVVGAKAARLAEARAAGLPVLNGFVIPVSASRRAIDRGAAALTAHNSGRARAIVTATGVGRDVEAHIAKTARELGHRFVARSSSVAEADGVWAGAFSSYAELGEDEIKFGVVGCWASVLSPDAVARGKETGVGVHDVGMAVLVQPEIRPDYGGVATAGDDGCVVVAAIEGPPAAILSGWERGQVALVGPDGHSEPSHAAEDIGAERLAAIARLARMTATAIGCTHIEWAEVDGAVVLLQAQPAASQGTPQLNPMPAVSLAQPNDRRLADVAQLLTRFPGPMGERFVWPWALARRTCPTWPAHAAQSASSA